MLSDLPKVTQPVTGRARLEPSSMTPTRGLAQSHPGPLASHSLFLGVKPPGNFQSKANLGGALEVFRGSNWLSLSGETPKPLRTSL